MNNIKYYNDSLAYDFGMFAPKPAAATNVGDEDIVSGDLLVHVGDLGIQQANFLVNEILLLDDGGDLIAVGGLILLQLLQLLADPIHLLLGLLIFLFHLGDLLFDGIGSQSRPDKGGQQAHQQAQQQDGCHEAGQKRFPKLLVFHRVSLFAGVIHS